MPRQIDLDKIIADNPAVDPEAFRKAEEALKNLHQTGVVKRSNYGLETPESKKRLRHSEHAVSGAARVPAVRRLR